MESNEKVVAVLNDLVQINNDRIEGYERATKETDDNDLKTLFTKLASKSHMLKSQLSSEIVKRGGQTTEGTTTSGKLFRVYMDLRAAMTGKDRKAILSSCEKGEDAAQETYETAMKSGDVLPSNISQLISEQKMKLREDHDEVKSLRDAEIHA